MMIIDSDRSIQKKEQWFSPRMWVTFGVSCRFLLDTLTLLDQKSHEESKSRFCSNPISLLFPFVLLSNFRTVYNMTVAAGVHIGSPWISTSPLARTVQWRVLIHRDVATLGTSLSEVNASSMAPPV